MPGLPRKPESTAADGGLRLAEDENITLPQLSFFPRPPSVAAKWPRVRFLVPLLLVLIVLSRNIGDSNFAPQTDSPVHLVTGFYFADFLSHLPLRHPLEFTYRYYAQYPALGLIHWPPLFHIVEGLVFLVGPRSVVTAKIVVLLFTLLGLVFWFKLIRDLHGEAAALLSTCLVALAPGLLQYETIVMLEIPTLALCITAIYFWVRYLRSETSRYVYWFAVFSALALLTKQHSIYLLSFCLLSGLASRKWHLLFNWNLGKAFLLSLVLAGPFYAVTLLMQSQTLAGDVLMGTRVIRHPVLFYWIQLPGQLGWPLLGLSVIGILTWRKWTSWEALWVMLCWIASCFITFTPLAQKSPRYCLFWLPPFVYFAAGPLVMHFRRRWLRPLQVVAIAVLLAAYTWSAWTYRPPYVAGYAPVVSRMMQAKGPVVTLFDGNLGADFIFHVRASDPERRCIVLRKELYVTRWMSQYGKQELLHSSGQLENLVRSYGIRYVVVEDGIPLTFDVQKTLREFLNSPQFRLVASVPIETNLSRWKGRRILLYENSQLAPAADKVLHLNMLTLGRQIDVPLGGR